MVKILKFTTLGTTDVPMSVMPAIYRKLFFENLPKGFDETRSLNITWNMWENSLKGDLNYQFWMANYENVSTH